MSEQGEPSVGREGEASAPSRAGCVGSGGPSPPRLPSAFAGSTIMYGALLLFESEFVHIVAISFTSLILTELLMVALTIQTWHWLMTVAELLSLACYIASLVFLHEFIGETPLHLGPAHQVQGSYQQALVLSCPPFAHWHPLGQVAVENQPLGTEAGGHDLNVECFL